MTTFRTTLVAFVATLGLTLGLVGASTVTAGTASAASKPSLKKLPAKVKLQVKSRATLYDSRTGKVVRDRHDRAKRLSRGTVKVYTHRARIKGREYRRIAGKRYLVRLSSLRTIPKPVRRPVAKPAPKPVPAKPKPPTPKPVPPKPPVVVPPAPTAPPTTLVFGDSITAWYNDLRDDWNRGWWSFVKEVSGGQMIVEARPGSGMVAGGQTCTEGRFGSWLHRVADVKPDFIIVEGGRNDIGVCNPDGTQRFASQEEKRAAIFGYVRDLSDAAKRSGVSLDRVYLWAAWGHEASEFRSEIVGFMESAARQYGIQYVDVPPMLPEHTIDGTHPNLGGSTWLAGQFMRAADYDERVRALVPTA